MNFKHHTKVSASGKSQSLGPFLERVHARYHRPEKIGFDPLRWPRMYETRADREVVAFISSSLAYGNVVQINRSLENLFSRMGSSPARFAREFVPGKSERALEGFYHRFNDDKDIAAFVFAIGQILRGHGSIEGFWAAVQSEGRGAEESISVRTGRFFEAARQLDFTPYFSKGLSSNPPSQRNRVLYLLPDANGPSACKRINMFLRWVVRPDDGVDLGLWSVEQPESLEYPVDTHIHRIARFLGATRRKNADANARREITNFFRVIRPDDPVRYDFALCRMGILRTCPTRSRIEICNDCELRMACNQHRRLAAQSKRSLKLSQEART